MSEETDYQIGVHNMDTTGSIADEEDVVDFEFEPEAVFKRLADDVYETAEAGIREPLMNSITAVRKAFGQNLEEGVVRFTVKRGNQTTVRIRDNGIGITRDVLDNILTVIGRSSVRDDGSLTGQYGMGFLASYKLVGPEGGFLMTTNPRHSSEGPYSGLFRPGAFEPNTEENLPQMLDKDEYGTVFEFHTKEGIEADDVSRWVEKHARWSPVPVIYEELDKNGNEVFNEDFHTHDLSDRYGDSPYVSYEDEFFEVATSPEATGEAVLISSPMEMAGRKKVSSRLSWNVDIRLKYENGVVIKGDHQGLTPVNYGEYDSMDEERKEGYVAKKNLKSNEVTLPSPIGTREKLESNEDFIKYANKKIKSEFKKVLSDVIDNFDPSNQKVNSLTRQRRDALFYLSELFEKGEYVSFLNYTPKSKRSNKSKLHKISAELNHLFSSNVNPNDDIVEFINLVGKEVRVKDGDGSQKMYVHNVVEKYDLVEDIYMCVSTGTWKFEAVQDSSYKAKVISVQNSDMYESLSEQFGWTPLKEITAESAHSKLGLSESKIESLRGKSTGKTPPKDRIITVHKGRQSENIKANELKASMGSSYDIVVLFPRGFKKNLTDNKWMAKRGVAIASCPKRVKSYLTDNNAIVTYKEYKEWVMSKKLYTSEGRVDISTFINWDGKSNLYPTDITNSVIKDEQTLSSLKNGLSESHNWINDSSIFGIIQSHNFDHLKIANKLEDVGLQDEDEFILLVQSSYGHAGSEYNWKEVSINLVDMYLKSELNNSLYEARIDKSVRSMYDEVTEDFVSLVDSLNKSHSIGGLELMNKDEMSLPVHQTKDGKMSIKEIYSQYSEEDVIINLIDTDIIGYFQNEEFLKIASERLTGKKFEGGYVKKRNTSESIYVPVTRNELDKIKPYIGKGTTIIFGLDKETMQRYKNRNSRRHGNVFNSRNSNNRFSNFSSIKIEKTGVTQFVASIKMIYAKVVLSDWKKESLESMLQGLSFSESKIIVDSLRPLHNAGESPPV